MAYNATKRVYDKEEKRAYMQMWAHGKTEADRVAQMCIQNDRCMFCGRHENDPPNGPGGRMEWDHCHETEIRRGLAHGYCNRLEGYIHKNPTKVKAILHFHTTKPWLPK